MRDRGITRGQRISGWERRKREVKRPNIGCRRRGIHIEGRGYYCFKEVRNKEEYEVMANDEMKVLKTGNQFIKVQYIKHSQDQKHLPPPTASLYMFPATAS